ncbi:LAETG motif-containing sortase-dependent surface protein [Streptomyces chattanoogensis]|uniref:LAETG motif-containing sortase-dependent surface protein n=1 Tax=Streptomyces chattanoogensis TaxID=66876 RepID=UPI00369DE14C
MKLRRALTAAAAAAVLTPAALMAAPAAYATDPETGTATGTESSASADPAPATPDAEQTDGATAPADEPTTAPAESGAPTAPADEPTTGAPSEKPTAGPTDKPTAPASPTAKPTADPSDEPECAKDSDEQAISTELRGLPSKVVAGSGWKNFTFRATNTSDKAMKSVDAYVALAGISGGSFDDVSQHLTVQWFNEDSGAWEAVTDTEGYFATVYDLGPDEYADAKLRLKVDAKTPGSYGFAFTIGAYHDEDDVCGFSDVAEYDFDILVAGSKPGTVPPAKGKPGKTKGNKPAPQGDLQKLPVTGKLAETGSSSALPVIGMVGGIAMAVGAGAIFVVRRRKAEGAAAA